MWIVELVDWFLPGSLVEYGIRPREAWGLLGILFAPFLHRDVWHLLANTAPLAILGAIVLLGGVPRFARVSGVVAGLGGVALWACGETGTVHVGASGLVFGYFGYLVARGYFDRSPGAIAVALVVGILYSGLIWGVLPLRTDLSWLGHLFGLASGVLCARIMQRRGERTIDSESVL